VGLKSNHTIKKYLLSGKLLKDKYFIGVDKDAQLFEGYSKKSNNKVAIAIRVINLNTGEKKEYVSLYAASKELGIHSCTIKKYLDNGECYKNIYRIEAVESIA
jgi:hypothetical protein